MTAAFIQTNGLSSLVSTTTLGVTYSGAVGVTNLLFGKAQWDITTTTCTVSDGVNGAWTAIGTATTLAGVGAGQLFYKQNTAAGTPTVTMTTSTNTGYRNLIIAEYSGIQAVAIDSGTNNSATGTGVTPAVTVTSVADHDLIIAAGVVGGTISTGNGNVRRIEDGNAIEDFLDKTPAGGQSCTFTQGTSVGWIALGVGFLSTTSVSVVQGYQAIPFIPTALLP